ncbi:MAG TPA: BA14K family protein [Pseudolabrys sp.]|nr:BA14K family protein [Pseudolabrys sp.]
MQFLVYLAVLMVSVSTVLLEIHWLTTPPPQPNPAQGASVARPKAEGPNAELSSIYPKRLEPTQPTAQSNGAPTTSGKAPADAATSSSDNARNAQAYAPAPLQNDEGAPARSTNRCDIQACAGAYKSFRASDCTYQPFEGPRRVCSKVPGQRADREQAEGPRYRAGSSHEDLREPSRRARRDSEEDDDGADDMFRFRWRRPW